MGAMIRHSTMSLTSDAYWSVSWSIFGKRYPREAMEPGDGWFLGGMAMYISEWYRERREVLKLKTDFSQRIIPKPEELSGDRNYTCGCVLFESLLKQVGPKPLLDMIKETNHQNIIALLSLEQSTLWEKYLDFVHIRIGFIA